MLKIVAMYFSLRKFIEIWKQIYNAGILALTFSFNVHLAKTNSVDNCVSVIFKMVDKFVTMKNT